MKTVYRKWIGGRLKELRLLHKFTPLQISEMIGMHVKTYCHYEEGVSMPSIYTLKLICTIYTITLDKFMEGSPTKEVSEFEQQSS